jgi:hypothetical protein
MGAAALSDAVEQVGEERELELRVALETAGTLGDAVLFGADQ